MILGIDDVVAEALHRRVGWDIRHHFMAEKIVDRFGLVLPRDCELIRQLAVVYVPGRNDGAAIGSLDLHAAANTGPAS